VRKEKRIFTDEEMKAVADFFVEKRNDPYWWNPVFYVALITFGAGLRGAEAKMLLLEDCTVGPIPSVHVTSKKGGGSLREVAILPQFRPYFLERVAYLNYYKKHLSWPEVVAMFPPARHGTDKRGFVNVEGMPKGKNDGIKWWYKVMAELGIEGTNCMTGRRSWATYVARMRWTGPDGKEHQISPMNLARQMGHNGMAYLMEYYDQGPAHMRFPCDAEITWPEALENFKEVDLPEAKRLMVRYKGKFMPVSRVARLKGTTKR